MEFRVKNGNYVKSANSTNKIFFNVLISLIPIIIFHFYKNGILACKDNFNIYLLFRPLIIITITCLTAIFTEYLCFQIMKRKKTLGNVISDSFPLIYGIILGLIIPIDTNIIVVFAGTILASVLGKMVYGGFARNITNPALIGWLLIILVYLISIFSYNNVFNELNGNILLKNLSFDTSYVSIVNDYGSIFNIFFGNIKNTLGIVSPLLCIIAFIYLMSKRAIKWRISLLYILTVFIMSLVIGLINGANIFYPFICIFSSFLFFGAIFIASDMSTSPITSFSQSLYGIVLGVLTIAIRYLTPIVDGVFISILIMNLFVPLFNKIGIKSRFNNSFKVVSILISLILIIVLTIIISIFK